MTACSPTSSAALPTVALPAVAPVAAPPHVQGTPRVLLRLEGLAVLVLAVIGYAKLGGHVGLFALCFLLPDLSMLGYLAGRRVGAASYNTAHSYLTPAVLALFGVLFTMPGLLLAAAIWAAHIGFDRALGYGLKYGTAFGHTHLGNLSAK